MVALAVDLMIFYELVTDMDPLSTTGLSFCKHFFVTPIRKEWHCSAEVPAEKSGTELWLQNVCAFFFPPIVVLRHVL